MDKKQIWKIAKNLMASSKKKADKNDVLSSEIKVRIISDSTYNQSSGFRGFKRLRLTIYKEYGVDEGIDYYRKNHNMTIPKETPIRLLRKEVTEVYGEPFQVLEVYANNHKVGVIYGNNSQYDDLVNKPFDKVYIKIEETVGKGEFFDGVEVYLFVHYIEQ